MSSSTLLRVFKSRASWDIELNNALGVAILWMFLMEEVYRAETRAYVYVVSFIMMTDEEFSKLEEFYGF